MDHHEQHHQQHRKEREHEKHERKAHEHLEENQVRTIHPAWFVGIGGALIILVVLAWIIAFF
jgi:hypothetical protein